MAANRLFAAGEYTGPLGAIKNEKEWADLARELSNHGPQKSVDQWKHTWRDLKKKTRDEASRVRQAHAATGNNTEMPKVSEISDKILDIIGHECATGIQLTEGETGLGLMVIDAPLPEIDIEVGSQIIEPTPGPSFVQPTAGPSTEQPTRQRSKRTRTTSKENNFIKIIKAQEKNNEILEEIRKEIKMSNEFREVQLKILQEISDKLNRSA